MRHGLWLQLIFLSVLVGIVLQGCGGADQPPQASPAASAIQPPQPQRQATVVTPKPEQILPSPEKEKENYAYDPEGRPDPFKSILLTGIAKKPQILPPLQQRDLSELKVIAIIWGGLGQSAMVQTPDGKGYTVRVGTRIGSNQGVVKRITAQSVVVEERYTDVFGENKTREVVLNLGPSGEKTE